MLAGQLPSTMRRLTRRRFLAASASATLATAGCLGTGGGRGDAEPIVLESVAVGPSPGGTVPVREPGRVALVDFFATWCAPCKPQMASLGAIDRENPDVHLVSVTQETDREAIEGFWRTYHGTWPVAMDPELRATEAYGADRIPTLVVLAPDGTEVFRHTGLARQSAIQAAIDEASA